MKAYWLEARTPITPAELNAQGIYYAAVPPEGAQTALDALRAERGYIDQDEIRLHPQTDGLQGLKDKFKDEHAHDDDEVRYVKSGAGVFDIRSEDDRWMRVEVTEDDLIVVPKDRYHRFFLTETETIHCVRLFRDTAGWTPKYRS